MKKLFNKGFTLLELLIVILIIGILAAIALPQYKKSVLKSRLTSMLPYVRAVKDAQERHYLINNSYSNNIAELDVNLTCPSDWTCNISNNGTEVYRKSNTYLSIIARYDFSSGLITHGKIYCWASYSYGSKQLYRDVCKSFGPLLIDSPSGTPPGISYLIQ